MFKIPPNLKIQQDKSVGAYYPTLLIVYVIEILQPLIWILTFQMHTFHPPPPPSSQGCYKDKK